MFNISLYVFLEQHNHNLKKNLFVRNFLNIFIEKKVADY